MDGGKLVKGCAKLREALESAWAEGEELPAVECAFSLEAQKQIRKHLGDLPANLITSLQEKIESLQEASDDLDELLDVLEQLGAGYHATAKLEQISADVAVPVLDGIRMGVDRSIGDELKVKDE